MEEYDSPLDSKTLALATHGGCLIELASGGESHIFEVGFNLAEKSVTVEGVDEGTEALRDVIDRELAKSLAEPVTEDNWNLLQGTVQVLSIPDAVVELQDATGWSTAMHAFAAIAKAAQGLGSDTRHGQISNLVWEGQED